MLKKRYCLDNLKRFPGVTSVHFSAPAVSASCHSDACVNSIRPGTRDGATKAREIQNCEREILFSFSLVSPLACNIVLVSGYQVYVGF